jgi:hypothetical protein
MTAQQGSRVTDLSLRYTLPPTNCVACTSIKWTRKPVFHLKGISTPSVEDVVPVRPIFTMNKDDDRIVRDRNVAEGLEPEANLAAMPWEDFEHLVASFLNGSLAVTALRFGLRGRLEIAVLTQLFLTQTRCGAENL